jgi:hypothetical protein
MKSRKIAIAGSIAALAFAAAPITAIAATGSHPRPAGASRIDRSRDTGGVRHTEKVVEKSKSRFDISRGVRDK